MSNKNNDIDDGEIRIISSNASNRTEKKRKNVIVLLCAVVALLAIGAMAVLFMATGDEVENETVITEVSGTPTLPKDSVAAEGQYVSRSDTLVDGIKLIILTPVNAAAILEVGNDVVRDSSAVLIAQAADVREDNGRIVGSFVTNGELISKGEAKAGFCSIIDGKITVGVADATPIFEQALTSDGYFFRQYPLVVGGQVIENKPKGKSIRKALSELEGNICVVISEDKITFHDFSQALVDIGVRNAIYLVGSDSYGRYKDRSGDTFTFGNPWDICNVNYIVWR